MIYDDAFSELCGWLEGLSKNGYLVSMIMVKEKYEEILRSRDEIFTDSMIRTQSIRDRLANKFKDKILFSKVNNRQGVFVSWNDLSTITHSALTNATISDSDSTCNSNKVYCESIEEKDLDVQSVDLFHAIETIRKSMRESNHYMKKITEHPSSISNLTSGIFWDCIPTLVKNFIGLLIMNDEEFLKNKDDDNYSHIFTRDLHRNSDKSLKISSIVYDIFSARYDSFSTPKHILLANELFHHVRSSHLLDVMNRFGHTCSYKTMVRKRIRLFPQ